MDRRAFVSLGAALLASGCAPGLRRIELGQELQALVDDPLTPLSGLSVLVQRQGRVLYEAQFGRRWIAPAASGKKDLPIDADTIFRVASISKLVLGLGVMRLVDAGRLDLEADIGIARNPNFPDAAISTRMLLSHTSSLTDAGELYVPAGQTMAAFLARPDCWAKTKPGSYFQYSNLAYGLLAAVIERASGQRFDVYMQQQVLGPLAMQGGYDAAQLAPEQLAQVATLYRKQDPATERWNAAGPWIAQADDFRAEPPKPMEGLAGYPLGSNGSLFGPQGRLRTRVRDLGTVAAMLARGGALADGSRFLSEASVSAMTTELWRFDEAAKNGDNLGGEFQAWGLGLQHYIDRSAPHWGDRLVAEGGLQAWGHLGFSYGLQAGLMFDPASQASIVYVIGGHAAEPGTNRGRYSSYPAWEEQVHQRLWTAALEKQA
ncbi:serine hydrolase [Pelomonas sp. KK5]|uniref:serine hydrolase domain-containing protein n=1 Tax=Pelomonas sp. KK5 TaxID=1855730 RepID=UPI00097C7DE4|nr:serine hydrolase domain-containing protein [Pelomonas sp. KK5]